jgi:hypothetical protein
MMYTFDPRPDLVHNDPPFGAIQFTVAEVHSVILELDVSKGAGPDGIPPLILNNQRCIRFCATTFSSFQIFIDRWKLSYVTPVFKKSRRNNVEDYRGVALSVRGFQDCMEIQSDLSKLSGWCELNSLFLNVDKC